MGVSENGVYPQNDHFDLGNDCWAVDLGVPYFLRPTIIISTYFICLL